MSPSSASDRDAADATRPGLGELARAWFAIGSQSIGGGPSTLYLIRQVLIHRRRWISEREYLEDWALSRLSVGMGFIAFTGLIGRRIGGTGGIAVSVASLLLPSAAITLLLTVLYEAVRSEQWVVAAFTGAGPVTAGMLVGIGFSIGRQGIRRDRSRFIDATYWSVALFLALVMKLSPLAIVGLGAFLGLALMRDRRQQPPLPVEPPE